MSAVVRTHIDQHLEAPNSMNLKNLSELILQNIYDRNERKQFSTALESFYQLT